MFKLCVFLILIEISPNPVYLDYNDGLDRLPNPEVAAQDSIQIKKLINQLGDDSFKIRQEASDGLETFGIKAIPELSKSKDSQDLEVRRRVHYCLNQYFSVVNTTNPGIWFLPKKYRFVDGEDIAVKHYLEARKIWISKGLDSVTDASGWYHNGVSRLAMSLYLLEEIKKSDTDNRLTICLALQKSIDIHKEFATFYNVPVVNHSNDVVQLPPKSIEEIIEEGRVLDLVKFVRGLIDFK